MSDPASDCKYCGGDCPNQPEGSEHLCDGYAGDIDGLYGDTQSLLEAAAEKALHFMYRRVGGCGGIVAVDKDGDVGVFHTTERMAWAIASNDGSILKSGISI